MYLYLPSVSDMYTNLYDIHDRGQHIEYRIIKSIPTYHVILLSVSLPLFLYLRGISIRILFLTISSVSPPKQDWLQVRPRIHMSTMFAQDISRILLPRNVKESKNLCRNSFAYSMVRQGIMSLLELRIWGCGVLHYPLVISK